MTTTIEISLYPLHKEYPSSVLNFLQILKSIDDVEIQSNGMSTLIVGSFEKVWPQLGVVIHEQFAMEDSIFVLKIAPGRREYND